MSLTLNVRFIAQSQDNSCWLAAARMVASYRNRDLHSNHLATFMDDHGLHQDQLAGFAHTEGFLFLKYRSYWDSLAFERSLSITGPLMCLGNFAGYDPVRAKSGLAGHFIVVVGILDAVPPGKPMVQYLDPALDIPGMIDDMGRFTRDIAPAHVGVSTMPLSHFNRCMGRNLDHYPILYLPKALPIPRVFGV